MMYFIALLISLVLIQSLVVEGFCKSTLKFRTVRESCLEIADSKKGEGRDVKGFFGEFFDAFNNLDGIAEDFFYKRMGKGEIFYGKRKYKPSGDVEGDYNGFGLSDKLKIDMTREYKEAWLEEKRMRDEMKKIKEEKERRDAAR